ncbi:MAG: DUF222 domain-containing protein [Gemmatimonadota bacterium]|nr:DUF222 domain-containing protein [Gemmatimonadota bacterium]
MPADNTAIAPVHTTPAPDLPGHDPRLGDDPLGDRIAALCAHIDAATYRLLTLLRVYDEEGRWQGCRSCAHWLSWRTGLSLGPAREKVRVARCLPSLPLISAAFARGEISYSKVRALTRAATTGNEAEFLIFARHGTTAHVERLVREWRRLGGSGACPDDPANQTDQGDPTDRRGLSLHLGDDGNYEIRGQLTPEVGALLLKALEATEDKLYREQRAAGTEHEITAAQRRADAFGLWLEEHVQPKVQLVVHSLTAAFPARVSGETSLPHMEAPSLVTEDGCRVSAETSSRLCCSAPSTTARFTKAAGGSRWTSAECRTSSTRWGCACPWRRPLRILAGWCPAMARHLPHRTSGWPAGTARPASVPRKGAVYGRASTSTGAGRWCASGGKEVVAALETAHGRRNR